MSAQQQLAELLRNTDNRAGAWQFEAQHWIRDHGPAIAELIECQYMIGAHYNGRPGTVTAFADLVTRRDAALRKLTQDA